MSNTCEMIQDLLPLYVDNVCSDESKTLVEQHLEECQECKKLYDVMKGEVKLPVDTNTDQVRGFKKFVKKKIFVRTLEGLILFVMLWLAACYALAMNWSEIWPKADADGISQSLEVVDLDGTLYLHQTELFGFGEIVCVENVEEENQGIIKFYLGENGIHTLDPFHRTRSWIMNDKYARIPTPYSEEEDIAITKIVYCHKDGTEVVTLWEDGKSLTTIPEDTLED